MPRLDVTRCALGDSFLNGRTIGDAQDRGGVAGHHLVPAPPSNRAEECKSMYNAGRLELSIVELLLTLKESLK
jgi:hypothetical protein